GLTSLHRNPRPELSLDGLQPQQNATVLADDLIAEPGPDGNQKPRQNGSEYKDHHRRSPWWFVVPSSNQCSRRADRAPWRSPAGGGSLGGKDPTGRLLRSSDHRSGSCRYCDCC